MYPSNHTYSFRCLVVLAAMQVLLLITSGMTIPAVRSAERDVEVRNNRALDLTRDTLDSMPRIHFSKTSGKGVLSGGIDGELLGQSRRKLEQDILNLQGAENLCRTGDCKECRKCRGCLSFCARRFGDKKGEGKGKPRRKVSLRQTFSGNVRMEKVKKEESRKGKKHLQVNAEMKGCKGERCAKCVLSCFKKLGKTVAQEREKNVKRVKNEKKKEEEKRRKRREKGEKERREKERRGRGKEGREVTGKALTTAGNSPKRRGTSDEDEDAKKLKKKTNAKKDAKKKEEKSDNGDSDSGSDDSDESD